MIYGASAPLWLLPAAPSTLGSTQGLHPATPPQGHVPQRVTSLSPTWQPGLDVHSSRLLLPAPKGPVAPCPDSPSMGAACSPILAGQTRGAREQGVRHCHGPLGHARRLWKGAGPSSRFSHLFDPTPGMHHPRPASSVCFPWVARGGQSQAGAEGCCCAGSCPSACPVRQQGCAG